MVAIVPSIMVTVVAIVIVVPLKPPVLVCGAIPHNKVARVVVTIVLITPKASTINLTVVILIVILMQLVVVY